MRIPRAALTGTLVLLGAVLGLALPALEAAIIDVRTVAIARLVARALALARDSAIARNQRVQFHLDHNGRIVVRTESDGEPLSDSSAVFDASNVEFAVHPHGAHLVTFNGLGWSVGNADRSAPIQSVDVHAATWASLAHPSRRILLSAAGGVILCDPGSAHSARLACAPGGEFQASSLRLSTHAGWP